LSIIAPFISQEHIGHEFRRHGIRTSSRVRINSNGRVHRKRKRETIHAREIAAAIQIGSTAKNRAG
jgi:hypothetical protein